MDFLNNIILTTDSYKPSHWKQYPPGTSGIFSFFESRGGIFPTTTFFGLQYYLKRYLVGQVVTEKKIKEAKECFGEHFGDETIFNEEGWYYILTHHGGRLPILVRAVPEGTTVPTGNILMSVESTDEAVPWLAGYLEGLLSHVWYPTTVCTQSRAMKADILSALEKTGDGSLIDFKLHDFGFRGVTCVEQATIGGTAHLVNFKGTDNLPALVLARQCYGEKMAGFSIPAAEHSTITSWGREDEVKAFANMLSSFPTGAVAVVSDSYDIFHACRDIWGKHLKRQVLARDGVVVIRPDSGDPLVVLPEIFSILAKAFGSTVNEKGYRLLHPKVRVIQGDGIDRTSIKQIMDMLIRKRWSIDNLTFGSGGGLLQKVNRDTQKFAMKCSAVEQNGMWHDVYKDPITDPGKRSKRGRLKLVQKNGIHQTLREEDTPLPDSLTPVFRDGFLLREETFAEIRQRALQTEMP